MKVEKAIKELRVEKNISQNKLSKLTGLNRGYVYKLEKDLISPSVNMLEKVANTMEVRIVDIIAKADQNNP